MSQINTNTIANELGTGGPDFVGMPTVGGDPIVESGSNSDGEWTRWADGTQLCRTDYTQTLELTSLASGFYWEGIGWTFPIPFSTTKNSTSANARASSALTAVVRQGVSETSAGFYVVAPASIGSRSYEIDCLATGRWK